MAMSVAGSLPVHWCESPSRASDGYHRCERTICAKKISKTRYHHHSRLDSLFYLLCFIFFYRRAIYGACLPMMSMMTRHPAPDAAASGGCCERLSRGSISEDIQKKGGPMDQQHSPHHRFPSSPSTPQGSPPRLPWEPPRVTSHPVQPTSGGVFATEVHFAFSSGFGPS